MLLVRELTEQVMGLTIKVHRFTGPADLSSKPLRAAPWSFVRSVLNACSRTTRTVDTGVVG